MSEYKAPIPENTLTNADGTPYSAGSGGDWLKLTPRQREDVITLRDRMNRHLMAETEAFYVQHPGLRLTWSFVCDALIREQH